MAKKTIKAQMKQRRDTKANWAATNPVLLDGELGIVSDDPNLYKVGDGATAWNSLPFRGFDGTLVHETGTSENAVMSQKAVSEKLTELESKVQEDIADIKPIVINGDVVNAADEEDITSEDNLLKLKDRDEALGMGYVILRKNKTFAEQVTKENTIYEIRYDFDGASATCNIPSDAVLLFNGGRILNMTVIGNNTAIVAPQTEILNNVTIDGTFNNSKVFSEWVGLAEGGADNFNKLVALMNLAKGESYSEVFIQSGDYYTSCKGHYSAINIPSNTHVYNAAHIYALPSDLEKSSIFTMIDVENVIFEGGRIIGDLDTHNGTTGEWGYGIYLVGARHCIVRDVHISRCWGDGIDVQALYSDYENKTITGHCYDITIERVVCDYNRRQGMSIEGAIGMVVRDSVFSNTGKINGTLPMAGIDVEPWYTEEVVRDLTFENCTFEGNQGHNFFISLTEAMFLTENCRDFLIRNCSFLEGELVTLNRTRGLIFDCNHVTCVFATNKNHDMLIQNNKFDNQVTIFSEGYADGGKLMANTINSQLGNILEIPLVIGNRIYGGIRGQRQVPAVLYKNNIIRGSDNEEFSLVNTMATFEGNHITLPSHIYIKNNSRVLFYNNVIDAPSGVTAITMQTAHQSAFPNDGEIIGNLFINTLLAYRNWSGAGVYEVRSNTYAAARTYGTTEQRPVGLDSSHIGFMFYDTTIWKPIWWAGTKWADATGAVV